MNVPLTPLRCLTRAMDQFGAKVGIVCGEREFTYLEFGARCGRLATALRNNGLQPQERVAYLSFNTHKLMEGYYGVPQAGGVVMPLNVRLSPPEFVAILNHADARWLFFEEEFAELARLLKQNCPSLSHVIGLDTPAYEELLNQGREEWPDVMAIDENSVAELFYTSGSTGLPKGVMLTHRNLYLHALGLAACQDDLNAIDLHTIPLFHANGWGCPQVSTMMGYKQVMVRRFEPATVFSRVQKHRATEMSLVPTMANMLLNAPGREQYDLSSLRSIMIGGAASSPELIQRMEQAFHCRVFAGYGLSEAAPVLTMAWQKPGVAFTDERDRLRRTAMAGWPIPVVELCLMDLNGARVPKDGQSIGEICARGDNVMAGYFRDEAGTANVIYDGWLHTGDMAVWDETGYLHIVDRKKEIIVSGGENISSLEVEKAIFSHPAVYECAVVAAPDEKWGEVPAAYVVLKEGASLNMEELLAYLEGILGKFKLPRIVEFHSEPLPKTGTGKIRKLVLRERFWAGKEKRVQG